MVTRFTPGADLLAPYWPRDLYVLGDNGRPLAARGNVLGVYLHGLLEDPAVLQALFGRAGAAPVPTLDSVFERLADCAASHFQPGVLSALID